MWPNICKQILSIKINRYSRKKIKLHSLFNRQYKNYPFTLSCAQMSQKSIQNDVNSPLCKVVNYRQSEAKRSIVVQVQSSHSYRELYAYCNNIGNVKFMAHYTCGVEPQHFILIEFTTEDDVKNVLTASSHLEDAQAVPVHSPFLWFRVSSHKTSLKLPKKNKLNVENGLNIPSNETIMDKLKKSESISEQMQLLYDTTKLNDLGTRLRFLTARQVELALAGMFTNAVAYPFGSSINGYGKMGCDLDLILKFDSNKDVGSSRLVYQCKESLGSERSQSQRHMEAIGDLLQLFLPGCTQVRRILQARVPILKYNQQFTAVECDLSMTNMTAFHMSELLYLYGTIDNRVRPLVFTIRKWAQEIGLTNSSPGRWITNFSLTLLVLAFLQRSNYNSPSVLPSVNALNKLRENPKNCKDELELQCAFVIEENKLPKSANSNTLHQLLLEFFEYYSGYDFTSNAISLNEATDIIKPEHSALYIVNPLEKGLNVSKNISIEELERLRIELRNAAWTLDADENKNGMWGILSLFYENGINNTKYNKAYHNLTNQKIQGRLVEVRKIFEGEKDDVIEFKNETTKKKINEIKKDTQTQIREIGSLTKRRKRSTRR